MDSEPARIRSLLLWIGGGGRQSFGANIELTSIGRKRAALAAGLDNSFDDRSFSSASGQDGGTGSAPRPPQLALPAPPLVPETAPPARAISEGGLSDFSPDSKEKVEAPQKSKSVQEMADEMALVLERKLEGSGAKADGSLVTVDDINEHAYGQHRKRIAE
jgi:hypothetical protein